MADTLLNLFVKYPRPGAVKTRIGASHLGHGFAATLYSAIARDMAARLCTLAPQWGVDVQVCYAPQGSENEHEAYAVRDWLGVACPVVVQCGDDLGARMAHALAEGHRAGYARALILGSDVPDVPSGAIADAVTTLRNGADAVLGPCPDGGYWLVGLNTPDTIPPDLPNGLFGGVAWSTPQVLAQTLARFGALGIRTAIGTPWRDVDEASDLPGLYENLRMAEHADCPAPLTLALLEETPGIGDNEPGGAGRHGNCCEE